MPLFGAQNGVFSHLEHSYAPSAELQNDPDVKSEAQVAIRREGALLSRRGVPPIQSETPTTAKNNILETLFAENSFGEEHGQRDT
jgi:hypothetical protein